MSGSTTPAPPPFDQADADIILRSSDGVDFRVHSVILSQASPFFRAMFTLPQPQSDGDTLPVIDCTESGRILLLLLTFCYPIIKPKPTPLDDIEPAVLASQKYEMELPVELLKGDLCAAGSGVFPVPPYFRVWAIACRLGFEEAARNAGAGLTLPMLDKLSPKDLEYIVGVSAANYYRLREHKKRDSIFTPWTFLTPASSVVRPATQVAGPTDTSDAFCSTIPYSDMICRSSDGVDFPTHRAILAMASSILHDKISGAEHQQGTAGTPSLVLQLDEDATLLKDILDICCYHRDDRLPSTPLALVALMKAIQKYGLTGSLQGLRARWDAVTKDIPLSACLIAAGAGESEWVNAALPRLLREPESVFSQYDPVLETTSALAFHKLLMYHKACRTVVDDELRKVLQENPEPRDSNNRQPSFTFAPNPALFHNAVPLPNATPLPPPKYFLHTYLHELIAQDDKGPYCKVDAADDLFVKSLQWDIDGKPKAPGPQPIGQTMQQLSHSLPKRLEKVIKAVNLDLSFNSGR